MVVGNVVLLVLGDPLTEQMAKLLGEAAISRTCYIFK